MLWHTKFITKQLNWTLFLDDEGLLTLMAYKLLIMIQEVSCFCLVEIWVKSKSLIHVLKSENTDHLQIQLCTFDKTK